MIHYIRFDDKYRLEISAYEKILPEYNYTPVRLKTLATINAFFVLLNYGDKIKPILDGYTLKVFIAFPLICMENTSNFKNLIRKARHNCFINNIYCSIINRDNYGLYIQKEGEYSLPKILEESKSIEINPYYYNFVEISNSINEVELYLNRLEVIKYEDDHNLNNGGLSWFLAFDDNYQPEKDLIFMRLSGMLGLACKKYGWYFAVTYAQFKHSLVVRIYRYETDLYSMWSASTKFSFTTKCINEANTIRIC